MPDQASTDQASPDQTSTDQTSADQVSKSSAAYMVNGFDPDTLDDLEADLRQHVARRLQVLGPAYKLFYRHPVRFVSERRTTPWPPAAARSRPWPCAANDSSTSRAATFSIFST